MLERIFGKRKEGFTIVEVMIVLAIAGLIILIVFLAVPALQRNSRNNQRNNDVSLVGAAINECLNNRNGQISACDAVGSGTELDEFLDDTKLSQITNIAFSSSLPSGSSSTETVNVAYGNTCNDAGTAATSGSPRAVALLFNTEGSSGDIARCQEV